jgi:hypothetical protein
MTAGTYELDGYFTYFQCYDIPKLPQFDFLFGGYWLQVSVDDLVLNLDGTNCVTLIAGVPDYVLLGNPLLRNFYTIYDMKNLRMGFAALPSYSSYTTKADPVPG